MSNQSVINPKNITIAVTLLSLIGLTPLCSGDTYTLYGLDSPDIDSVGLSSEERLNAMDTVITAYKKEVPGYKPVGYPYYTKGKKEGEFLLLLYPYGIGCGNSCAIAILNKDTTGDLHYIKDIDGLYCHHTTKDGKQIQSRLECQTTSLF